MNSAFNIHVSTSPPHLKITQTMAEDFLIDPVMGAKVIMGITLDAFQASRLRTYWWVPNVIDSSGVGTGKTAVGVFVFANLRCLLLGDQRGMIMYQNYASGKSQFWSKYREFRAPIFQAQIGKLDEEGESEGKSKTTGASLSVCHFKCGSQLMMPAPDWLRGAEGRAGEDVNFVALDEWTKSANAKKEGRSGIDEQIIARVRRAGFNQHHPLWGNHWLFTASAQSPNHPAYARVREFERRIKQGDPNYAHISYSYKDYSDRPSHAPGKTMTEQHRNEAMYENLKGLGSAEFKRQALGLWAKETKGWYTEEALARLQEIGMKLGLEPETERSVVE